MNSLKGGDQHEPEENAKQNQHERMFHTIDICNKTLAAKNPIDGPFALLGGKLK